MKDITPIIETRIANLIFDRQVVVSDLTKTLEDKKPIIDNPAKLLVDFDTRLDELNKLLEIAKG